MSASYHATAPVAPPPPPPPPNASHASHASLASYAHLVSFQLPSASPPEIMRAAEKDEQTANQLGEALLEAARAAAGGRWSAFYEREVLLAARVAYFTLTTAAGQRSLGEEYCDIMQVSGPHCLPASPARRSLLVALHTVLPYVADRFSSRAAARGVVLAAQQANEVRSIAACESSRAEGAGEGEGEGEERHGSEERVGRRGESTANVARWQGVEEDEIDLSDLTLSSSSLSSSAPRSHALGLSISQRVASWRDWMRDRWHVFLRWWGSAEGVVREGVFLGGRAHLMMFYFSGAYFHLSKRVAAIRYAFTSQAAEGRPRYHILGVFLLVQLAMLGSEWVRRRAWPLLLQTLGPQGEEGRRQGDLLVLDEEDVEGFEEEVEEDEEQGDEEVGKRADKTSGARGKGGVEEGEKREASAKDETDSSNLDLSSLAALEGSSSSKCALCLSERQDPAATPCGHVFCWTCIAEWCNEKPECPLCRSPFIHSSLVGVYHADF